MSGTDLTISGGNTLDVATLQQTLSLSGTTLTISGANGNVVDLSTFSGVASSSITDLSDVDTTGATTNQFLKWNGSAYVWSNDNNTQYSASDFDITNLGGFSNAAYANSSLGWGNITVTIGETNTQWTFAFRRSWGQFKFKYF